MVELDEGLRFNPGLTANNAPPSLPQVFQKALSEVSSKLDDNGGIF
jgi:hypothetical protein